MPKLEDSLSANAIRKLAITSLVNHGYNLYLGVTVSGLALEDSGQLRTLAIVRAALTSEDGPVLRVEGTVAEAVASAQLICVVQPQLGIVWLLSSADLQGKTFLRLAHAKTLDEQDAH